MVFLKEQLTRILKIQSVYPQPRCRWKVVWSFVNPQKISRASQQNNRSSSGLRNFTQLFTSNGWGDNHHWIWTFGWTVPLNIEHRHQKQNVSHLFLPVLTLRPLRTLSSKVFEGWVMEEPRWAPSAEEYWFWSVASGPTASKDTQEWRGGKWWAPVVSRSTSRLI